VQLRVARHTERLEEVVGFYRDGLGLTEIGGFQNHAGYDGVFLEVSGTDAHLELTAGGGHGAPASHPESLLALSRRRGGSAGGRGSSRHRAGRPRRTRTGPGMG
jgi:hypothetical protein